HPCGQRPRIGTVVVAWRRLDLHVVGHHAASFDMLQMLGNKVPIIEISLQKSLAGLLPGPGTFFTSSLFFLVGLQPRSRTGPQITRPPSAQSRRGTRRRRAAGQTSKPHLARSPSADATPRPTSG